MLRKFGALLLLASSVVAGQRPFTHADYDAWRHIQDQQLSEAGHYLGYGVFPQQGDGEVVLRNLTTGAEIRQSAGQLPPPPPPNNASPEIEEAPPAGPKISIKFTPDESTAVFLSFASHEEVEKAKRAKRRADEMPKGDLVIVDLRSGKATRIPRVISYQLPAKTTRALAYLQAEESAAASSSAKSSSSEETSPAASGARTVKGELYLRNLKSGEERRFHGVTEYSLLKDSSSLVFAASAEKPEENGIFSVKVDGGGEPLPLLTGKGKYQKLTWNEEETRLAFLSSHDDANAKRPHSKLYSWDGHASTPSEVASDKSQGLPTGWILSERAPLSLSKDGRFLFFGTNPEPPLERKADNAPADEKVSVDLWAWNDDYIQPMQKARAATERSRSYRAAVDINTGKFVQLADPAMNEIVPAEDGSFSIGNDDRDYRRMQEYDERYSDSYLVETVSGKRTLLAKKHLGRFSWSPDSRHAAYFNGKDWMLVTAPDGSTRNLTAGLGVTFGREVYDMPGTPPAEGQAIWTKDGKSVLFYDRFDVWRYTLGTAAATNLTHGYGRTNHLAFRIVRSEHDDPSDRYLDIAKTVILRAENEDTRDTGFFRLEANGAPVKLTMAAKNFGSPIKARNADVYVTTESTFSQYPDLETTNGSFQKFQKVTNVGAQVDQFAWGTAELMQFESADGVKLNGTLYKPANFDPKKKYPMLVYIYERLSQNFNNFVEPKPTNVISPSFYTSNGYLVLEPDIAYRIGYPGQSALRCVLPAVQEIVNRGYVDEKAIGIQGHSWGGYQIAYMVTQTNRFRAAAPGAPVANMISAYDGIRWGRGIPRQFQYERTQSRIGGTPWEYPLRYIENSPIFMVDRIHTPLLMIHNDADDAVPWYQGIEYYLALRRLNKEVYMFSYNGEPHNLRRRANQKDYSIRLQQFFDYYLKGAAKPDWMEHGIPFIHKSEATVPTDSDEEEQE